MSDPYLNFIGDNDLSNIQVNVFRVRGSLRGMMMKEKEKYLHEESFIFNPKNSKVEIPDIKLSPKHKIIREKIYLSDTIENILNKIAFFCCEKELVTGHEIYAWIDMNPKREASLRFCYPLGIHYSEELFMNPYIEKKYDDKFANTDGSMKRDPKLSLDMYSSYGSYYTKMKDYKFVKPNYNIYFCTAQDIINYIPSSPLKDISENHSFYGFIKKYFPSIEKFSDIGTELETRKEYELSIRKNLDLHNLQKKLQDEIYYENVTECRPDTLIYRNRIEPNSINIFKIFKEFELSHEIPYLRIYIDSYLDSCVKLYKDSIYSDYKKDKYKSVTKDLFKRWNRNITLENGFTKPDYVNKKNSLSFIIYDVNTTNYVTMILYATGQIEVYCERLMKIEEFKNKIMLSFISRCNQLIRILNKKNYSENDILIPILYKEPFRIQCSYYYDISDYNPNILVKAFSNLYTEFLVIEDDPNAPLHLLSMKSSNSYDPRNIQTFITKMKKKQLTDDKIIHLLSSRFGLKKDRSREEISDWERVFQGQLKRKFNDNDNDISILIQKVLDHVKISVLGVTCYQELHEIMRTISFVIGIYKRKKIDKKKDLPDNISK